MDSVAGEYRLTLEAPGAGEWKRNPVADRSPFELVPGDERNIKITTALDLKLAELLLS